MTLQGSQHGVVYPPLPPLPPPAKHARKRALEGLAQYLSLVAFRREGAAQSFRIPRSQIHVEQPDSFESLKFPAIAVTAGVAVPFDSVGLGGADIVSSTRDVHGPGTVLLRRGEHVEDVTLELWEDTIPGRDAMLAALCEALSPLEETSSLRLRLDDYFGLVADYAQVSSQVVDDQDTAKGRRRALLVLRVAVPVVSLISYETMKPIVSVVPA